MEDWKLKARTVVKLYRRVDVDQVFAITLSDCQFSAYLQSDRRSDCITVLKIFFRKYFFTCRIINLWNSLPAHVVHASSVNDIKNKLDAYWSTQEMMYNYRAEISGTGNRSVTT